MVPIIEMGISQHGKSPKPGGSIDKMVYFWMTLGYYRRWNPPENVEDTQDHSTFYGPAEEKQLGWLVLKVNVRTPVWVKHGGSTANFDHSGNII
jgi:hypothetical protein